MKHKRTALIASAVGLAAWLLILTEDERALVADRSTTAPSASEVGAAAAPHPRLDPRLEAPPPRSSGPNAAIARTEAEPRPDSLRGRVIDITTQSPIAGALFRGGTRIVHADEHGEFRYDHGTAGGFPFVVEAEGYCNLRGHLEAPEIGSPEVIEFSLFASGRGEVVGTVYLNGKPAAADMWWESTSRSGKKTTEKDGFYRLGNIEAGVVLVSASPAHWQGSEGELEIAGGTARLVVVAGERTRHDLNLVVLMTVISGRVIHEGGEASAGRTVMAESSIDFIFRTVTDSEGYYWLEVPDLGAPFRTQPGTGSGTPSRDVLPGATDVDFVLPDLADIVLLVRDAATTAELYRFAVSFRPAGERDAWEAPQSARDREADGFRFRSFVGVVDAKVERRGYVTCVLEDVIVLADGPTRLDIELESDLDR